MREAALTAQGTVYLLHFRRPYRHARHYLGFGREQPEQIEYEDEDPSIYETYAKECARSGAEVVLPDLEPIRVSIVDRELTLEVREP